MSVVIIGGNECMVRQYKDLCAEYKCRAKVFCKMRDGMKNQIGRPDLLVLFTNTTSHKMVKLALNETRGQDMKIARCHSSSLTALKGILDEHVC